MFPSRSEFDGFKRHWKLSLFYFDVEGMFFPVLQSWFWFSPKVCWSLSTMAPSSMWRGCCLLQLDFMGLRQPWCHDKLKTKKPTQNWRMLLQFACLWAFVQLSLSSVTLISWKRLEHERLRSTTLHTSHTEELDFFEPTCCWITRRFDVLFGLNGFHSRSSLCFDHAASFPEQFLDFRLYNPLGKFDKIIATECLVFAQESLRSKASDKAMLQHVVVSHIFQVYSWWWGGGTCTKPDF